MIKGFNGKPQVGEYRSVPLLINWNYIIKQRGNRKELNNIQLYLGRTLFVISIIVFGAMTFLKISLGERLIDLATYEPATIPDLLLWISLAWSIYASYLLRDRSKFLDKVKLYTLQSLNKEIDKKRMKMIDISNHFDHNLMDIFDQVIAERPVNYVKAIVLELLKLPDVRELVSRLGLKSAQVLKFDLAGIDDPMSEFEEYLTEMVVGSFELANEIGLDYVDERAVFLHFAKHEMKQMLLEAEVKPEEVDGLALWLKNEEQKKYFVKLWKEKASFKPTSVVNRAYTSGFAGTLNQFSRDYTVEVIKDGFTLSIAREEELNELIKLLTKGKGSSVLLIGEPGVGKTTLLKSLAVRMVVEEVPTNLKDMRLVSFDIAKSTAVSKNIESFKKKLQSVFEDVSKTKNIVLVLEDVVQLLSMRSELAGEVVGIMIDALDRYNIRLIMTATQETYSKEIKPRTGLIKSFDVMTMEEPSDTVAQQILIDYVPELEHRYKVEIAFDAIKRTVELSHKIMHDKVLPTKALNILEDAAAETSGYESKVVTEDVINNYISRKVGVKVGGISAGEREVLTNLEELMHKRVIDQVPAIKAVSDALRRSRAGLSGANRPIASFLFFGPTGVGKTEVAKTIAETYYGDEKLMIRLDMSEYNEAENLKRLIGQGSSDDFEGGFLTEPIREHPFSLVLLDEIEKANPKVLDLFLQILDEGYVKDGLGRKVDFTNTIIVATSNASSKDIAENLETGKDYDEVYKLILPKLRETFKVEFLNRFDKVIMFKPLSESEVVEVADLFMKKEVKKLKEKGIELSYSKKLLEELGKLGYNPVYGGRELRRVVQEEVEDALAKRIIEGELKSGSHLKVESLRDLQ